MSEVEEKKAKKYFPEMSPQERKLAALKDHQFQKGQSGNPAGRPKGSKNSLRVRLMRMMEKQCDPDLMKALEEQGLSMKDNNVAEAIAYVMVYYALKGDSKMVKLIAEQTEIPLPQTIRQTGFDGKDVKGQWTIQVVRANGSDDSDS